MYFNFDRIECNNAIDNNIFGGYMAKKVKCAVTSGLSSYMSSYCYYEFGTLGGLCTHNYALFTLYHTLEFCFN